MPIRPIIIDSNDDGTAASSSPYLTVLSYGHTRSGKTRFAATWPNAVFISDATERGWDTIIHMPAEDFYHPGKRPIVLPVHNQQEMIEAIAIAEQWVKAGLIDTIVIDSITFYAESWLSHAMAKAKAAGAKLEGWDLYGPLLNHLTDLRKQVHGLLCNVVWLALAKDPDKKETGGPMLPGSSRLRFPPACNYVFYHRKYAYERDVEGGGKEIQQVYEAHNTTWEGYIAGGRDNGKLGDSLYYPRYREIAEKLGLRAFDPKTVPRELIDAAFAPAAAAATAKPATPTPARRSSPSRTR